MKKSYNKEQIIKLISENTGYEEYNITEIFVSFEEIVNDLLLSANENNDIELKPIPGLTLSGKFVPKHEKRMPDGSYNMVEDTVKFTAKFTNHFKKTRKKYYDSTRILWERVNKRRKTE